MGAKDEPCKKCGIFDRYVKGDFSYCRPCHTEAQKRYMERRAFGESVEVKGSPRRPLHSFDFKNTSLRLSCKNGHPLIGENLRVSSQRGGKHLFRRCRTCERNAKRVKYGLPIEDAPLSLSELLDSSD